MNQPVLPDRLVSLLSNDPRLVRLLADYEARYGAEEDSFQYRPAALWYGECEGSTLLAAIGIMLVPRGIFVTDLVCESTFTARRAMLRLIRFAETFEAAQCLVRSINEPMKRFMRRRGRGWYKRSELWERKVY